MGDPRHDPGREASGPPRGRRVLLVDDPRFDAHRPLGHHPERPERLAAARAAVAAVPIDWERVPCREATLEELVRVHEERFVEALSAERGGRGFLDADTYVSEGSVDAAFRAAGGAVALVDALLDGPVRQGVALLRPPGHHARPARAMGFCLLNNVAVAAAHARARGVQRVAVVDFDVHHGNGTQEMFFRDASVLYVSTHQFPFYPGTGAADEVGEGDGTGYTVNVPLRAGGGDAEYRAAFDRIVAPVLAEFAPELVLVSAGFDAAVRDPLAEMRVSAEAFAYMASVLARQAEVSAEGRMAMVLEGGYDLPSLERGLVRAMEGAFLGAKAELPAPGDPEDVRVALASASERWQLG